MRASEFILTEESTTIDSPAFKAWFAGSVIVDQYGDPPHHFLNQQFKGIIKTAYLRVVNPFDHLVKEDVEHLIHHFEDNTIKHEHEWRIIGDTLPGFDTYVIDVEEVHF